MSGKWRHPKVFAALVFCGAVAVLITVWRIEAAGRGAVERAGGCSVADLKYRPVHLEMARTPARVRAILAGVPLEGCGPTPRREERKSPVDPACVREGVEAQVEGDDHLLGAYSFLTFALFLFAGASRFAPAPAAEKRFPVVWALFALVGLLFALAMGFADYTENRKLLELSGMAEATDAEISAVIPALRQASGVKLGALALSALVLGFLWPSLPKRPWLSWLVRLAAWSAAVYLLLALAHDDAPKAICGVALLTLFWLAALVHAVVAAVHRDETVPAPSPPPGSPPPARPGSRETSEDHSGSEGRP